MAHREPSANPSGTRVPHWWTRDHDADWQKSRETLRREWERSATDPAEDTGATTTGSALGDILTQMTGHPDLHYPPGENHLGVSTSESAAATLGSAPSRDAWQRAEPAMRFGHAAYHQYGRDHPAWSEQLEVTLRREWQAMCGSDGWHEVRDWVRHGWDAARRRP
jgi:hypothetical protein